MTVRLKLHELHQGKSSLEEFAEEVTRLVPRAYPEPLATQQMQEDIKVDVFLRGCNNSRVAYEVLDLRPKSLQEAKSLIQMKEYNYKATVGRQREQNRARLRQVAWADGWDSEEETLARRASGVFQAHTRPPSPHASLVDKPDPHSTEKDASRDGGDFSDLKKMMKDMMDLLKLQRVMPPARPSGSRDQSPHSRNTRGRSPSPSRASSKNLCFRCGEPGHFRDSCPQLQKSEN